MKDMERKIGEIFDFNGIKLIVKRSYDCYCYQCYFYNNRNKKKDELECDSTEQRSSYLGSCMGSLRSDSTYIHFEKLTFCEKIKYYLKNKFKQ